MRQEQEIRSSREGRIGIQRLDLQIGKLEPAHLSSLALICFSVVLEGALPTRSRLTPREEGQVGGVPVTSHEAFQVTAIPGILLRMDHALDRGPHALCGIVGSTTRG